MLILCREKFCAFLSKYEQLILLVYRNDPLIQATMSYCPMNGNLCDYAPTVKNLLSVIFRPCF